MRVDAQHGEDGCAGEMFHLVGVIDIETELGRDVLQWREVVEFRPCLGAALVKAWSWGDR